MTPIRALVRREYLTRVRSKAFLFSTFGLPILMAAAMAVPALLETREPERPRQIGVADVDGAVAAALVQALDDTLKNGRPIYDWHLWTGREGTSAGAISALLKGRIQALLWLPPGVVESGGAQYLTRDAPNLVVWHSVRRALRGVVIDFRFRDFGIDLEEINRLRDVRSPRMMRLGEDAVDDGGSVSGVPQTFITSFLLSFLIYLSIVIYGAMTMSSVIQDKTSRVMEMVLGGASPFEVMAGKIVGIGAVGATQMAVWIAVLTVGMEIGQFTSAAKYLPTVQVGAILTIGVSYLLGYTMFATLLAGVGAVCGSEEEAKQLQLPVVMLVFVPMLISGTAINKPDSPLIATLSRVPWFAPILMYIRVSLTSVP
jgi:ABC-2 type transport system permease protein